MLLTGNQELHQFATGLADFLNSCGVEKSVAWAIEYGTDEETTGAGGSLEKCLKEAAAKPDTWHYAIFWKADHQDAGQQLGNLNTLLDDNKVLKNENGKIEMPSKFRFVYVTNSAQNLTPAVVSRLGQINLLA